MEGKKHLRGAAIDFYQASVDRYKAAVLSAFQNVADTALLFQAMGVMLNDAKKGAGFMVAGLDKHVKTPNTDTLVVPFAIAAA